MLKTVLALRLLDDMLWKMHTTRNSEKGLRGKTWRRDSKERLLKECCPSVTKARTYQ